ncbi:hypothetical protein JXL83_09210, partial [candidate division WOR-3 bacterium]|nr:hypothetical protein [candidate division WOR-3 bacterium]
KGKSPEYHWVYLPQKNLLPYRVGCSSNFYGSPEGKYSIYAEISYGDSKKLPRMNEEAIAQRVLCQLKKAGLIDASSITEKILTRKIDPAYVLFDFERKKVLRRIFSFFKEKSIFPLGRYGRWEYSSMEESIGDAMDMTVFLYGK